MGDDNQITVPDSFLALFTRPGSARLTEPAGVVRARYELCEDLAQMLAEQADARLHASGMDGSAVLRTMLQGLRAEHSPVAPREAVWAIRRSAELLGWEQPAIDDEPKS